MTTTIISHNLAIAKRCVDALQARGIEVTAATIPESLARKPVITIDGNAGLHASFLRGVPYIRRHYGAHTTETHAADYQQCQVQWLTRAGA